MKISILVTGPLDVNTYIISGYNGNECIVADPADFSEVMEFLTLNGLKCTHILITHGHFDHILGVAELKEKTNALVCIHENGANTLSSDRYNLGIYANTSVTHCKPDVLLTDGQSLDISGIRVDVLHTPGHSPDSVCYVIADGDRQIILSGDTIFRLDVGRTDLPGSSEEALQNSILNKLFKLPGDYRLLPGHMRESTLDFERNHNRYIKMI